jgi:hypothetical protein
VAAANGQESSLSPVLAEQVRAVNAFGEDAIVATFVDDALVNEPVGSSGVPGRSGARDVYDVVRRVVLHDSSLPESPWPDR